MTIKYIIYRYLYIGHSLLIFKHLFSIHNDNENNIFSNLKYKTYVIFF